MIKKCTWQHRQVEVFPQYVFCSIFWTVLWISAPRLVLLTSSTCLPEVDRSGHRKSINLWRYVIASDLRRTPLRLTLRDPSFRDVISRPDRSTCDTSSSRWRHLTRRTRSPQQRFDSSSHSLRTSPHNLEQRDAYQDGGLISILPPTPCLRNV